MAETRVPLSFTKWTLLGAAPLSYEIAYGDCGGYLPIGIITGASLPDPAETKFSSKGGKEHSGIITYSSGNVYARALTNIPTTVVVSKGS